MIMHFEDTEVEQYYADDTASAPPCEVWGLSVGSSTEPDVNGDAVD